MKKVLFTLLLGLFILTGCSFSNEDKEEDHSKSKSSSQNKKRMMILKRKMINILILSHQKMIQKAMMNLLIKAMKTVLPANSNLLLTRLLRMQSKSIFTI